MNQNACVMNTTNQDIDFVAVGKSYTPPMLIVNLAFSFCTRTTRHYAFHYYDVAELKVLQVFIHFLEIFRS